jgi:hypothetical protein
MRVNTTVGADFSNVCRRAAIVGLNLAVIPTFLAVALPGCTPKDTHLSTTTPSPSTSVTPQTGNYAVAGSVSSSTCSGATSGSSFSGTAMLVSGSATSSFNLTSSVLNATLAGTLNGASLQGQGGGSIGSQTGTVSGTLSWSSATSVSGQVTFTGNNCVTGVSLTGTHA